MNRRIRVLCTARRREPHLVHAAGVSRNFFSPSAGAGATSAARAAPAAVRGERFQLGGSRPVLIYPRTKISTLRPEITPKWVAYQKQIQAFSVVRSGFLSNLT